MSNLLLLIASFLLAFIPLYPKIPLFDILPGYIVRVRLEDTLVLLAFLYYLVQIFKKKVDFKNKITPWIVAYLGIASLSILSAIFLIKTIPPELLHIGKSVLHLFRYTEYFSLFFIMFSAIKKTKDVKVVFYSLIFTVLAISIYGYGQRYWYWPVFSTMNREFSKGMVLYLTEHARVQSTFGGHYDLAAYLVIVLPIFYLMAINAKNKWQRRGLHLVHLVGLWLLVMSASRTSFIAYIGAVLLGIGLFASHQERWGTKLLYFLKKSFAYTMLMLIMMYSFGADMRERFEQVLRAYPETYKTYEQGKDYIAKQSEFITNPMKKIREYQDSKKPKNGIAFDNTEIAIVLTPTDEQPTSTRPIDVYVDVPDKVAISTEGATTTYVDRPRVWSANAMKYGLSFAIRLDELWPNAVKGLMRNPLLGSGYATLNKREYYQFTEAESTDNNFLRTLGETGLLGFVSFYGAIVVLIILLYRNQRDNKDNKTLSTLQIANIAFIAASVGLLLNASYIDVFASSKVAFTYWALAGAILAFNNHVKKAKKNS